MTAGRAQALTYSTYAVISPFSSNSPSLISPQKWLTYLMEVASEIVLTAWQLVPDETPCINTLQRTGDADLRF